MLPLDKLTEKAYADFASKGCDPAAFDAVLALDMNLSGDFGRTWLALDRTRKRLYRLSESDGAFAEYLAVDIRNLILLPDDLSFACASLVEPGAVARAAVRRLEVKLGDTVVIWGAGPIGLIAAAWAKRAGASVVRVVDISEEKLAFAKKFGFEAYDEARDGLCDCAIEGTGAPQALCSLIQAMKPHSRVILMGNPARDMTITQSVYSQILRREITLRGTWNSSYNDMINDWEATVAAMADGSIQYEGLITHRYPISRTLEALEMS